ncbi:hypothetical protein Pmar_PMAR018484 [Perkinsus marinus ATCC 50983]|uniref:Uncharacterized protein n=1 Tax=Perkinsus marinus (strain ATCC 50983 / TXsc) TaxID=423536 RepID=C5KZY4_PERM5|nr:hypothetical protein Pmar_PMAR018484 [Perkinsus marinus ATCC 50983]EER09842.1 hypothetical protein Pmar_PMAR018484 [Perkinsus marinus ATCC 50983]|eukprot:XP_002778047.1 hypothetical protein Pmar_PMAR018484 [Perkinsus marinus ATCC 50983]
MASPPVSDGFPEPPPFPTPPPGFSHPHREQLPEETELQRRKRQALQRMSALAPPPPAAERSIERCSSPDSGYGPAPDPEDKGSHGIARLSFIRTKTE